MLKNRKYTKNRKYSKNRPVQPKNRKNRKLNRFWPVGGFLIFFIFFYFTLRRFVQNENLTLKVPKPKLTLSSVTPHFSPHLQLQAQSLLTSRRGTPQARSSQARAARLSQALALLASAAVLLASVSLSQHSGALCTAARLSQPQSAQQRAPCSAPICLLCSLHSSTGNVLHLTLLLLIF